MTPSEAAKFNQLNSPDYPGIDNWTDSNLHQGNILYIWEKDNQMSHGDGNVYAMTPNTAYSCDGDPNKLQEILQTNLNPKYPEHRGHLQAYEINGEIPAAFSHVEANTCHGAGGGEQYFIPNFDQYLAEGKIQKADHLNLHFNERTLPIDPERISIDQNKTDRQAPITTPEPSPGTTPTLEGAYSGPTPDKADELSKNINNIQKEWDQVGNRVTSENVAAANGGGSNAPPVSYGPSTEQLRAMKKEPDFDGLLSAPKTGQDKLLSDQMNNASSAANAAQDATKTIKPNFSL